jgi:hypothetical protein
LGLAAKRGFFFFRENFGVFAFGRASQLVLLKIEGGQIRSRTELGMRWVQIACWSAA